MLVGKHARRLSRGDTLIEVLFAITVLSLAIVISLSIMNQGTAASLRSLQITLVRQQIDSQAETLRFMNSSYVAAYTPGYAPNLTDSVTTPAEEYYRIIQAVKNSGATSVSAFGNNTSESCAAVPVNSFIVNPRIARYEAYDGNKFSPASSFSQLVFAQDATNLINKVEGLWIEAVRATPANGTSYTDFHIRACWGAPGTKVPMNIGTIVRLYDPTN